ncbi:MAG: hypothetical protein ACRDXC_14950 [Acidimicrobiales bacterium]
MTDLVVLVLVVLWIAVLTPRLVRRFREGRSNSSIDSFHEQLHLLERTGPKLVEPAYRLEVPELDLVPPVLALVDVQGAAPGAAKLVDVARRKHLTWERKRTRRRRRDVLLSLAAVAVTTGVLGAMHAFHLLWAITGISALAIAGYVALAAYAQMLHADRDAVRPVSLGLPELPAVSWRSGRPRHAAISSTSSFEILTAGSPRAARAGYPGAWDRDEVLALGPRHAASGA